MRMFSKVFSTLTLTIALYSLQAETGDTVFRKDNPNLLYTTKDYYIELPNDCYSDIVCLQDFFLIMTFNVGIDGSNTIKQAGYKDADMECNAKAPAGTTYKAYSFKETKHTITDDGYGVQVEFAPEKKEGAPPYLQKFEFTGKMQNGRLKGMLTFTTPKGIIQVPLN